MKAPIALALISLLPLPVGFLTNHLVMTVWFDIFPSGWYLFMGLFFLLLWLVAGLFSLKWIKSKKEVLIYLNTAAGLVLILVLIQELILGRYWGNWVGISTQFYYLPLIHIPRSIIRFIPGITIRLAYLCISAFFIQLLASYLGCKIGERFQKQGIFR